MKKIYLFCAAGMSTSMMVNKMKAAAKDLGMECEIEAYAVAEVEERAKTADIVLLGPQVRFRLDEVKGKCTCPVECIEPRDYGTMNGANVMKHVKEVLGE